MTEWPLLLIPVLFALCLLLIWAEWLERDMRKFLDDLRRS